jgi:hypothetical protein
MHHPPATIHHPRTSHQHNQQPQTTSQPSATSHQTYVVSQCLSANTQRPTSNAQHTTHNIQHTTPNTQHPIPNTQHLYWKLVLRRYGEIPGCHLVGIMSKRDWLIYFRFAFLLKLSLGPTGATCLQMKHTILALQNETYKIIMAFPGKI